MESPITSVGLYIVNFIEPSNLSSNSATLVEEIILDWDPVFCQVSGFCTINGYIQKISMHANKF